jgi:hypothetical protein
MIIQLIYHIWRDWKYLPGKGVHIPKRILRNPQQKRWLL